ncbi:MAG: hypothetical protein K6T85_01750 [Gorillibacterium sp.]|nr:hypothetical protein [Gorillibacterium sp.]
MLENGVWLIASSLAAVRLFQRQRLLTQVGDAVVDGLVATTEVTSHHRSCPISVGANDISAVVCDGDSSALDGSVGGYQSFLFEKAPRMQVKEMLVATIDAQAQLDGAELRHKAL